jgi:hypothetical protein
MRTPPNTLNNDLSRLSCIVADFCTNDACRSPSSALSLASHQEARSDGREIFTDYTDDAKGDLGG